MYSIQIKNARFHLPIGIHKEEHLLKNEIILNLKLSYESLPNGIDYIDYIQVYEIASTHIKKAPPTLEEALYAIRDELYRQFPECILHIEICKNAPPILGEIESVCVSWED